MDAVTSTRAVNYALVRLQPSIDAEEFLNIGVVLVEPRTGFFGFRLETKALDRALDFFAGLDAKSLEALLLGFHQELERLRHLAESGPASDPDYGARLFKSLTKEREGVLRFGDPRIAIADEPSRKLNELFDRYVVGPNRRYRYRKMRAGWLKKRSLVKEPAPARRLKKAS